MDPDVSGRARPSKTDLVQVIVLSDELLKLRLNVDDPLGREFKLNHRYPSFLQVLQEAHLGRLQKQKTSAFAVGSSSGAAYSMDVVSWVIWRIKLNDPIHGGNLFIVGLVLGSAGRSIDCSRRVLWRRHRCR